MEYGIRRNGRKRDGASGRLELVVVGPEYQQARRDGAGPSTDTWQRESDREHVSSLVLTIMRRLEIARDTTIVGLLGVGASKDNEDELCKWVTGHLPKIDGQSWEEQLSRLCREFVLAIDEARGS